MYFEGFLLKQSVHKGLSLLVPDLLYLGMVESYFARLWILFSLQLSVVLLQLSLRRICLIQKHKSHYLQRRVCWGFFDVTAYSHYKLL